MTVEDRLRLEEDSDLEQCQMAAGNCEHLVQDDHVAGSSESEEVLPSEANVVSS